jgi:hypothetical protein
LSLEDRPMAKKRAAKPATPQTSLRLPDATKAQLVDLSRHYMGASRTQVIIRLVADHHASVFGEAPKKNPKTPKKDG